MDQHLPPPRQELFKRPATEAERQKLLEEIRLEMEALQEYERKYGSFTDLLREEMEDRRRRGGSADESV